MRINITHEFKLPDSYEDGHMTKFKLLNLFVQKINYTYPYISCGTARLAFCAICNMYKESRNQNSYHADDESQSCTRCSGGLRTIVNSLLKLQLLYMDRLCDLKNRLYHVRHNLQSMRK
jgi:hypothetical protein